MFIDCHCHIENYKDISKVIERARNAGVGIIVNNSVDLKSIKKSLALNEWFPEVKIALGIYPIEALKLKDNEINEIIDFIRKNKDKIAAIGEVGIDLKFSSDFEEQKKNFLKFVELALELDKPMIIHSRKAEEEVIKILEEKECIDNPPNKVTLNRGFSIYLTPNKSDTIKGIGYNRVIMHCFSGNLSLAERIANNSWMLSIPTNVVNNSQIQDIVKKIPIQNLLCETDSPYFHPFGERRNEPCYVVESYKKIAEIKGLELEEVEEQIEENFKKIFAE